MRVVLKVYLSSLNGEDLIRFLECINLTIINSRRSFHDLESHRSTFRLQPDQMRIDVELCGQVLTMMRRDEHLRDVATAVEVRFIKSKLISITTSAHPLGHRELTV